MNAGVSEVVICEESMKSEQGEMKTKSNKKISIK